MSGESEVFPEDKMRNNYNHTSEPSTLQRSTLLLLTGSLHDAMRSTRSLRSPSRFLSKNLSTLSKKNHKACGMPYGVHTNEHSSCGERYRKSVGRYSKYFVVSCSVRDNVKIFLYLHYTTLFRRNGWFQTASYVFSVFQSICDSCSVGNIFPKMFDQWTIECKYFLELLWGKTN